MHKLKMSFKTQIAVTVHVVLCLSILYVLNARLGG